jgi:uncharacterized protein YaiL (DUF2058 family)
MRAAGWAPKHHPTPLSGGDRKALNNELGKSRVMTNILAGKVGAGWSRTVSSQIRKQLDTRRQSEIQADKAAQETEGHLGGASQRSSPVSNSRYHV